MRRSLAVVAAVAVLAGSVAACGSDDTSVPHCKPHAHGCKQTSDGAWIPLAFWVVLFNQQRLTTGSSPAYKSSVPSSVAPSSSSVPEDELEPSASPEESEPPVEEPEPEPSFSEGGDE